MSKYQPQHAPNKKRRKLWRLAALPVVAVLVLVSSPAEASKQMPRPGEGWMHLQTRTCGNSAGWQQSAKANGSSAPRWILPLRSVAVNCPARHEPKASRDTKRPTGWVKPFSGAHCSSGWGAPRAGWRHQGLDMVARTGTPIHAVAGGKVVRIAYELNAGWYVVVDAGYYQFVYMHMNSRSKIRASVGQKVATNQVIAYVGSLGKGVTAPHLHMEIHHGLWYNRLNPAPIMRAHGVGVGC